MSLQLDFLLRGYKDNEVVSGVGGCYMTRWKRRSNVVRPIETKVHPIVSLKLGVDLAAPCLVLAWSRLCWYVHLLRPP
jgi:hypothetical protein